MQKLTQLRKWTPKTPFYYGWVVLGVSAMGTYLSNASSTVTMAGIQGYILNDTGWDRYTLSSAVTIGTFGSALLTPLFGRLADKYGPRLIMPLISIFIGVCFYFLSGATSVLQFFVFYILARAIGTPALISIVPRTAVVNFFYEKRNLALGIQSAFRPMSGGLSIQIISMIATRYNWRNAYKFFSLYGFLSIIPLFLFLRKTPESIGLLPDGKPIRDENNDQKITHKEYSWDFDKAIKTKALWLLSISQFLTMMVMGVVGFQFVPYLNDSGMSLRLAATAWSCSIVMDAIFNPVWGLLGDKFSPRSVLICATPLAALVTSVFLVIDGGILAFMFVAIWGAFIGGLEVLGGMLIANYYGRNSFGTISGVLMPFQVGGLGLGPLTGTFLFKTFSGYSAVFFFAVCAYLMAGFLIVFARKPLK